MSHKNLDKKSKKYNSKMTQNLFLLAFFIITSASIFVVANTPLKAQIKNLYNETTNQVAGISSLMSAVVSNDIDGVRFFSKAGQSLVNQQNIAGATAMHIACREKHLEIVQILIENGANLNIADNEGWTPLMRAAMAADASIVELLLQKGAQAQSLNSIKESAIIHAALSDCSDCLGSMFKNFNFIKLMNSRDLQDQLNQAYIITKNHDNQISQELIEVYLDQAVKMSIFQPSSDDASDGIVRKGRYNITSMPDANSKYEVREIPLEILKNDSFKKRFKLVVGVQGQKIESVNKISIQKNEAPAISQPSNSSSEIVEEKAKKKFKLQQGQAGQAVQLPLDQKAKQAVKVEKPVTAPVVPEEKSGAISNEPVKKIFKLQKGEDSKDKKNKSAKPEAAAKEEVKPSQPAAAKEEAELNKPEESKLPADSSI